MKLAPPPWLEIARGDLPVIVSIPHSGTEIPAEIEGTLIDPWLARKDADWWVHLLYDFVRDLGVTVIRTAISRTVIDANRDPTGKSLYPGQATTELCPTTTFDGEPLYVEGAVPNEAEIARRRARYFAPFHDAIRTEIARLRESHPIVVLYEAHSIRSHVPRLFEGALPQFNLGTNSGASCAPALTRAIESVYAGSPHTSVTNGRFKGGYTTRHYGQPREGVHTVQMELACRGYMREPEGALTEDNWPSPYNAAYAQPIRALLTRVIETCIDFTAATQAPARIS